MFFWSYIFNCKRLISQIAKKDTLAIHFHIKISAILTILILHILAAFVFVVSVPSVPTLCDSMDSSTLHCRFTLWLLIKWKTSNEVFIIGRGWHKSKHFIFRATTPWVGKIPWRRAWEPTPLFLPGESSEPRSLAGYSPKGRAESDTAEVT